MSKFYVKWQLVIYDVFTLAAVQAILLGLYRGDESLSAGDFFAHAAIMLCCVFAVRLVGKIYSQIWRYGGIQCYIRLLVVDSIALGFIVLAEFVCPLIFKIEEISFARTLSVWSINLIAALAMRMMYRYAYKCGNSETKLGKGLNFLLRVFAGKKAKPESVSELKKIRIAIVGAGRSGVALAEDLIANKSSRYSPACFIDVNREKAGRTVHAIPVIFDNEYTIEKLKQLEIQEVVFAIPNLDEKTLKNLCERYLEEGYKIKVYDYPVMQSAGKKHLREFDIEELLFRKPINVSDTKTTEYYKDKTILITGGGGSIGSELCRQLAKMQPEQIIVLDIYENGAYDLQQELRIAYGSALNLKVEICSITNKKALERVFYKYRPQIVINAAAHKHVPLMEDNCIEAVENNVFGTINLVELCESYNVKRFMMVSTDKAVNPTNVMGATKRMCEMIVQTASTCGKVKYSATRFGNVLGSAGSVIPLFKKQIANGGPITITDKRIIRYFMTIPEASQLVLQSGAMANNGELFVLDMGQPVRIYDLAQNMIRLSGVSGIDIIEVGLRPGEKLYEELLVKTEELDKTENSLIYIEKDTPHSVEDLKSRLEMLKTACKSGDDDMVRAVLRKVVPSYKTPNEINSKAESSDEMKMQKKLEPIIQQ